MYEVLVTEQRPLQLVRMHCLLHRLGYLLALFSTPAAIKQRDLYVNYMHLSGCHIYVTTCLLFLWGTIILCGQEWGGIWRDGCGVVFPFPVTLETSHHLSVCLSIMSYSKYAHWTWGIHRHLSNTNSTFLPSVNITKCLYDSVIQGYLVFVQLYDAHKEQNAEWSTVTEKKQR